MVIFRAFSPHVFLITDLYDFRRISAILFQKIFYLPSSTQVSLKCLNLPAAKTLKQLQSIIVG